MVDLFVPAVMNAEALDQPGWSWFQMWVRLKSGVSPEQVRAPIEAAHNRELRERLRNFASDTPRDVIERHLGQKRELFPAETGASPLQRQYQCPLLVLGSLVALVLLIACANLANLMTAQATGRAREMALRVSIGAGPQRLIQLVLVECAMMAALASLLGSGFARWSAPLVVSMLRVPDDPVRLVLDTGWREAAFNVGLALLVTVLFGLTTALRASAVQFVYALRGGEESRKARQPMRVLLAAQVGFCVTVLFIASLFLTTFHRLSHRTLGFSPDNVLTADVAADRPLPPEAWFQAADELRSSPGVLSVAFAGWATALWQPLDRRSTASGPNCRSARPLHAGCLTELFRHDGHLAACRPRPAPRRSATRVERGRPACRRSRHCERGVRPHLLRRAESGWPDCEPAQEQGSNSADADYRSRSRCGLLQSARAASTDHLRHAD